MDPKTKKQLAKLKARCEARTTKAQEKLAAALGRNKKAKEARERLWPRLKAARAALNALAREDRVLLDRIYSAQWTMRRAKGAIREAAHELCVETRRLKSAAQTPVPLAPQAVATTTVAQEV